MQFLRLTLLACLAASPAGAGAPAPACAGETSEAAAAACLGAEADRLLIAMETALVAGPATRPGTIGTGLDALHRGWRAAMEAECATLSAPDPDLARSARALCRLRAARLRAWRLGRAFGGPGHGGSAPQIEIEVAPDFRPGGLR